MKELSPDNDSTNVSEKDVVTTIIIYSFWLGLVGLLVRAIFVNVSYLRLFGTIFLDCQGIILVLLGLYSLLANRHMSYSQKRLFPWICTLVGIAILDAIIGVINEPEWTYWLERGILPYFTAFASFAGMREGAFKRIRGALFLQTVVCSILACYLILFAPPVEREDWFGEIRDAPAATLWRGLYAIPFLLTYFYEFRFAERCCLLACYVVQIYLAFLSASRGLLTILFVLTPVTILLTTLRSRLAFWYTLKQLLLTLSIFLCIAAVSISVVSAVQGFDFIDGVATVAIKRYANYDIHSGGSLIDFIKGVDENAYEEFNPGQKEESRGVEAQEFLNTITPLTYLMGNGFGVPWYSAVWGGNFYMVHIGFLHLILLGGIPLLLSFSALLLKTVITCWNRITYSKGARGAFVYSAIYLVAFLKHGVPLSEPFMYFFWICIGFAFFEAQTSQVEKKPC